MIITVAGAKGGVGKTTVALNLGVSLRYYGPVLVVDGNLSSPHIGGYLGSPHLPGNLAQALRTGSLDGNLYNHKSSGLTVLPGTYQEKIDGRDLRKLAGIAKSFKTVILDSGAALSNEGHHCINAGNAVLVVTTPDLTSVLEALRTVRHSRLNGKRVLGIVVNKSRGHTDLPLSNIASIAETPVVGVIPEDANVAEALRNFHPVVSRHQSSPAAIAYRELAENLVRSGLWS